MAAEVHRISKTITVPEDGRFPFWETMCGKRLDEKALAITSNENDVTCAACAPKHGSKRGLRTVK